MFELSGQGYNDVFRLIGMGSGLGWIQVRDIGMGLLKSLELVKVRRMCLGLGYSDGFRFGIRDVFRFGYRDVEMFSCLDYRQGFRLGL